MSDGTARARSRYSTVSIFLHWALAALILWQIFFNAGFHDMPRGDPGRPAAFAMHVSVGILILTLSLIRLGWRVTHPAPPLPARMAGWEKVLARTTQVLFYVFMIGMPLSGWLIVSGGRRPPPEIFSLFPLPRLPVGPGWHEPMEFVHAGLLLKGFYGVLFLHVAGALKHQFFDKDIVLWRMLPVFRRPARD